MGDALKGLAAFRRLALIFLIYSMNFHASTVSAVPTRGGKQPLYGDLIRTAPNLSPYRHVGNTSATPPYSFSHRGNLWTPSLERKMDTHVNGLQQPFHRFSSVQMQNSARYTPLAKHSATQRLPAESKAATSEAAQRPISALQTDDEAQKGARENGAGVKPSGTSSFLGKNQQMEKSFNVQGSGEKAGFKGQSEQAASFTSTNAAEPARDEASSQTEGSQQEEKDSSAQSSEEQKKEEEEESEEEGSQTSAAESSGASTAQPAAAAPQGGPIAASSAGAPKAEESAGQVEGKGQAASEVTGTEKATENTDAGETGEGTEEEEGETEENQSSAQSSEVEEAPTSTEETKAETKTSKTFPTTLQAQQQTKAGEAAQGGAAQSAASVPAAGQSEVTPVAGKTASQTSQELSTSNAEEAPRTGESVAPSQEPKESTAAAGGETQKLESPLRAAEGVPAAEALGGTQGEKKAATPPEDSKTEGVSRATSEEKKLGFQGAGQCYTDIAQEALDKENSMIKRAATNVHFQEADQGFCDEIFRRIDGPYSLAELSALLRAADLANALHRNFRYCRATEISSPPRVKDGYTVLHAAIAARKPHVTEVLLQYGAFPELPDIPLRQRQTGNGIVSSLALDAPESVNARPLHVVASIQSLDSIESLELLLQYGADVNSRDALGRTPLMVAAYHPKPHSHEFVKKLILFGADVNAVDNAKRGPLHYAAASDNWQVIRLLLDHGTDPAASDVRGNTPLHYAAAFNCYNSTTKLLEKAGGAVSINEKNSKGKAPIHLAAAPDAFQAVPKPIVPALALEALLTHHANPIARDAEGNNPLHLAARGGYVEIVRRLVALTNIPAEEKNRSGQTPLDVARTAVVGPGQNEIEQFLQVYTEKLSCMEPPVVRHSTRIFSDTVLGPYMRVGDTVTYTCNSGYVLYGHPTVVCQESDGIMEFVPSAPLCVLSQEAAAGFPWPSLISLTAAVALSAALCW